MKVFIHALILGGLILAQVAGAGTRHHRGGPKIRSYRRSLIIDLFPSYRLRGMTSLEKKAHLDRTQASACTLLETDFIFEKMETDLEFTGEKEFFSLLATKNILRTSLKDSLRELIEDEMNGVSNRDLIHKYSHLGEKMKKVILNDYQLLNHLDLSLPKREKKIQAYTEFLQKLFIKRSHLIRLKDEALKGIRQTLNIQIRSKL